MANSHRQTRHLLPWNLITDFTSSTLATMLSGGSVRKELASFIQAWAQDSWDLLSRDSEAKESIILLGQLLD